MTPTFLRIGGIVVELIYSDPVLVTPLGPAHRVFETSPATSDLRLTVVPLEHYAPPIGPLLFDSGSVWTLFEDASGYRIECRSPLYGDTPYKFVSIDKAISAGTVHVRNLGGRWADALEFPLDELLVGAQVTRRGGIELHACGVIDRDEAFLFPGNSQDGKTTTARLWMKAGAEVVSDDRVILLHEDGRWWIHGTPWHGEAEICTSSRAPLRQIYLIEKGRENLARPASGADAVARLFSCAFPPFYDRAGLMAMLDTLDRLTREVPVAHLSFVNDASAVEFVRDAARR